MNPKATKDTPRTNTEKNKAVVSIVIPSAPDRSFSEIVENLRGVKPDGIALQVIIVKGTWPPIQRNIAIKKATGSHIFLFDDDIILTAGIIEKILHEFETHPGIGVIGGPNLTPPENTFLQHCFGYAHGSWFTGGKTSARYSPAKENLRAGEDDLISCNLAFRAAVLKDNPFDPEIFPNEENDLLARMSAKGVRMLYTPDFFVYHHRRKSLSAYLKQIFAWGKGRMRRTIARPASFSPMFFVPLAFLVYLAVLALVIAPFYPYFFSLLPPLTYFLPLAAYLFLDIAFSVEAALKGENPAYLPVMPILFPLTHIYYGLGLIRGLATDPGSDRQSHKHAPHPRADALKDMHVIEILIS